MLKNAEEMLKIFFVLWRSIKINMAQLKSVIVVWQRCMNSRSMPNENDLLKFFIFLIRLKIDGIIYACDVIIM